MSKRQIPNRLRSRSSQKYKKSNKANLTTSVHVLFNAVDTNITGVLRILDKPHQVTMHPAQEFQKLNPCPSDYGRDEDVRYG